jgi:hypothetical protein
MTLPNPMSGPAYVMALRNALERDKRPSDYNQPPKGGGIQISVRLEEFLYNHVDAIVERSGWNRADVLTALVQRGLFDLYEFSHPETVEKIVKKIVGKMPPPHPPASEPDKIQYCLSNGEVWNSFPYPHGFETSRAACLSVAQRLLGTYWRRVNGEVLPMAKVKPLPDFVRVLDNKGEEICRWSVSDLQANDATAEKDEWSTAPQDGTVINVRFPDGKTVTEARWNTQARQWEVPHRGKWSNMRDIHGAREPTVWWR